MDTIQVSTVTESASEQEAYADVAAVIAQEGPLTEAREIRQQTARAIAQWWQSPGNVGHMLASFASGCVVDKRKLLDDIHLTRREARTQRDKDALDCLATFVINTQVLT